MARRASSSAHPVWIVVALMLAIGAIAGGYSPLQSREAIRTDHDTAAVDDYLENSNSLRGNVYKLDATISQSLDWSPTGGRLFSVEVGADVLPILVPASFNHFNLERGQRFLFQNSSR